jgi:hypothetical protein
MPVISARSALDASVKPWSDNSFAGVTLRDLSVLRFLLRQRQNDPMPNAIAANEPRPAPRPIARVDGLEVCGTGIADPVIDDVGVMEKDREPVPFDIGLGVGTLVPMENAEPKNDAVV